MISAFQEREASLALSLLHPNIVRCLGTMSALQSSLSTRSTVSQGKSRGKAIGGVLDEDIGFLIFEHIPGTALDLIQGRPGGLSMGEASTSNKVVRIWAIIHHFTWGKV